MDRFASEDELRDTTTCTVLSTEAELDAALAESFTRPLVLLKHSDSCGRSEYAIGTALRELESWSERVGCGLVVVQDHRRLSDAIARRLGVRHETPQMLLVRNGRIVWHASHWGISDATVRRALEDAVSQAVPH
jgi:bacillithiol system protein YtxJ